MSEVKAGIGGEHYQPYAERTGGESVVFFTRDLSAEGLKGSMPPFRQPDRQGGC